MLKYILIIKNVCERLFDELVKEWLKNRYSIISGTFCVIDGRKVRVRKSQRWIYLTRNFRLGCQICNLLWFSKFRQDSYRLSKCQQNPEWGCIIPGSLQCYRPTTPFVYQPRFLPNQHSLGIQKFPRFSIISPSSILISIRYDFQPWCLLRKVMEATAAVWDI